MALNSFNLLIQNRIRNIFIGYFHINVKAVKILLKF